jgi:putative PIN family toxin of toxin-antitoxin system
MNLVLDTNIVLDLFVFRDAAARELHDAIRAGRVRWLATAAMRDELACVLAYEQIAKRMATGGVCVQDVMGAFDRHANIVDAPQVSKITCRDADDQKFIDLACSQDATLLSKDAQVLALRRKLSVARAFSAPLPP